MISHQFDTSLDVASVNGRAYVVTSEDKIVALLPSMRIAPNQVILTDENGSVIVNLGAESFFIDSTCSSCLIPLSDTDLSLVSVSGDEAINNGLLTTELDVEQLQQQIFAGVDPTALFEESAAGAALGSSNAGFVVIDYGYAATLANAGFDTSGMFGDGRESAFFADDQNRRIELEAAGGQAVMLSLHENQLSDFASGISTDVTFTIGSGTLPLLANSLHIAPSVLGFLQAELADITSGGDPVVFSMHSGVNHDGSDTFTLIGTANNSPVIELILTATQAGNNLSVVASFSQLAPLDHVNESGSYVNVDNGKMVINLPVQALDVNGYLLQSPVILSLVNTDSAATGGERLDSFNQPLDLIALNEQATSRTYDVNQTPNSRTETVEFNAASDKLLPHTFFIDNVSVFKTQLEQLANNTGQNIDNVTVSQGVALGGGLTQLTITATINGQPAIDIILTSKQATDGLGMTVDAQFIQYQALTNPLDSSDNIASDYVYATSSSIDIKVPIQVEDVDGSLLVNPQDNSSQLARLVTFSVINDVLFVEESSIGPGTGISDGSESESDKNVVSLFQNGQTLTLDPFDEKTGDDFFFAIYQDTNGPVTLINGTPVNAHDSTSQHPTLWLVFLHQKSTPIDAYPKEYVATTNHDGTGLEVFSIILQQDGRYSFELLTAFNHPEGEGNNALEIELQAYSKNSNGNVTSTVRVPIVVEDDIPPEYNVLHLAAANTTSEMITAEVDVFASQGSEGADGAAVTSIFNGIDWIAISTTRLTDVVLYSSVAPHGQIGSVNIDPRNSPIGALSFTFSPSIVNATALLTQNIQYEVTDVDGDKRTGTITVSSLISDSGTDDIISDGAGSLAIFGGAGNDTLSGGLGQDTLVGGAGNDILWGGNVGGTGDGSIDIFGWQLGDFGTPTTVANDVINDFEINVDIINISNAFDSSEVFSFNELADRLSIQTVGSDTHIQVLNESNIPIQNISIVGKTLDDLLGVNTSTLTQSDILESLLVSGQLVVFNPQTTQIGTTSAEILTASFGGERLIASDGDDTLIAGLGDDILVGGEGDDLFTWELSSIDSSLLNSDTIADFEFSNTGTGDVIDISAILPSSINSVTPIGDLLDYLRPEVTESGLVLHVSTVANGTEIQNIELNQVGLLDLGLSAGATNSQIIDELLQQQALKLD